MGQKKFKTENSLSLTQGSLLLGNPQHPASCAKGPSSLVRPPKVTSSGLVAPTREPCQAPTSCLSPAFPRLPGAKAAARPKCRLHLGQLRNQVQARTTSALSSPGRIIKITCSRKPVWLTDFLRYTQGLPAVGPAVPGTL